MPDLLIIRDAKSVLTIKNQTTFEPANIVRLIGPLGRSGLKGDTGLNGDCFTVNPTRVIVPNYSALNSDRLILCDTGNWPITVDLFAGIHGRGVRIINCSDKGNDVTINPYSGETIQGNSAPIILSDKESISLFFDQILFWW